MPDRISGLHPRRLFCVLGLILAFATPAQAAMVDSDRVLRSAETGNQREAIVIALERDEVRNQLRQMGVSPAAAEQRVARLTPREVMRLQDRIDSLPAGGEISTVELLLIIILVLLIA